MGIEENFSFREKALNKVVEGSLQIEGLSKPQVTAEEIALNNVTENTSSIYEQRNFDLAKNKDALSQANQTLESAEQQEISLLQKESYIKEMEKEIQELKMDMVNQVGEEFQATQAKITRLTNDKDNFSNEIQQNQEILDTFPHKIYELGNKVAKGEEQYKEQQEIESKFEQN